MIASLILLIAIFSGLMAWRMGQAATLPQEKVPEPNQQLSRTLKTEIVILALTTCVLFLLIWSSLSFRTALALVVGATCTGVSKYLGLSRRRGEALLRESFPEGNALLLRFQQATIPAYLLAALSLALMSLASLWFDPTALIEIMMGFALGATFAALLPSLTFGELGGAYPEPVNAVIASITASVCLAKIALIMPIANPTERSWFLLIPLVVWGIGTVSCILSAKAMKYLVETMPQEAFRNSTLFAVIVLLVALLGYAIFFPGLTLWHWVSALIGATFPLLMGLSVEFVLDGEHGKKKRYASVLGIGFSALALTLLISKWTGGIEGGLFSMAVSALSGSALGALFGSLTLSVLTAGNNLVLNPVMRQEFIEYESPSGAFLSGTLSGVGALTMLALFAASAEVLVVSKAVVDLTLLNSHVLLGLSLGIAISAFWVRLLFTDIEAAAADLRWSILIRCTLVLSPILAWAIFSSETLVGISLAMAFVQLLGFSLKGSWSLMSFSMFFGLFSLLLLS